MKRILLVYILLVIPSFCFGQSLGKNTLKGITAVSVFVAPLNSDIEALGLTTENIKTDTELRLRKAGIKIAPSSLALDIATLNVYVQSKALKDSKGLYIYLVIVDSTQFFRLP